MQKVKKIWIILGILLAAVALSVLLLVFRFRSFVSSFLAPSAESINVLVLGKGGVGHEAPDLTDTIILTSISDKKINLVSIPRDIWVPEIRAKLNSAYYWGKVRGTGFDLVDDSVETITGIKPDYNFVVDFSVFKDLVDALGGIEVDVQNSFIDEKYPIAGKENDLCGGDKTYACRYEAVRFEKGKQMMNGEVALKFVRSRNAQGDEGTDFAREARQQLVISAIKSKALSPQTFLNPVKVRTLWKVTMNSIETDVPEEMLGTLARKAFDSRNNINSVVVPEELLVNPPISSRYDRLYVFTPKAGDWSEVQKWINDLLSY